MAAILVRALALWSRGPGPKAWGTLLRLCLRSRAKLSSLLYIVMGRLPLPAQDKWNGSLQLLRLYIQLIHDISKERNGPVEAESLVMKTLRQAGRTWIERRFLWSEPHASLAQVVEDAYSVLVKTLNLPSLVTRSREKVTITTFFCPFLDDAKRMGDNTVLVCERTCGEHSSLFKGVSEGFPSFVRYKAPQMMGRGAEMCVKELECRIEKGRRGSDGDTAGWFRRVKIWKLRPGKVPRRNKTSV